MEQFSSAYPKEIEDNYNDRTMDMVCPHCKTPVSNGTITEIVTVSMNIIQIGNKVMRNINTIQDMDENFGKERYHCSKCDKFFKELEEKEVDAQND